MIAPEADRGGLNQLGLPTFEPHELSTLFPNISVTGMDDETFAQKLLQEERVAVVLAVRLDLEAKVCTLFLRNRLRTHRRSSVAHRKVHAPAWIEDRKVMSETQKISNHP